MKIIHITASYKPAYIYGGPIMSVAKLCEALVEQGEKSKEKGERSKDQGARNKEQGTKSKDEATTENEQQKTENGQRTTTNEQRPTTNEVLVFTTTANGKSELNVEWGKSTLIDHVPVIYFERLTKDHTHFSPGLLWHLNKVLRQVQHDNRENLKGTKIKEQRARNNEQGTKKEEQGIDEKSNWLDVSGKGLNGNDEQGVKSKDQRRTNSQRRRKDKGEERTTKNDLIIHIHAWWNLVSIFSCFIAKWHQVPVVLSPRGMLTAYTQTNRNSFAKQLIHGLIGKRLLKYCHIHATSEQEKQDVLKIITPKSITVIPNLVDLGARSKEQGGKRKEQEEKSKEQEEKSKEQGAKSKDEATTENEHQKTNDEKRPFKIICLSRIEEKKGLEILFKALEQTEFEWCLTIAGSGEAEYIRSLKLKIEGLKLGAKIIWIGQVKNEAKFDLLADHDLLALTSYNENFANVVIESLNVGTPVLLSEYVGLSEYVNQNKLGWVTALNVLAIKNTIKLAFEDIKQRTYIRENASIQIAKDFDSLKLAHRYLELYKEIINE